jgi:hypothetical protein
MQMMEKFELKIQGNYATETIEWPILKSTEKAVLVETTAGSIWLPLWRFLKRTFRHDNAGELIALLSEITSLRDDAKVRVWKAGSGPSVKSHKFKVLVSSNVSDGFYQPRQILQRRTFTLAVSQVERIGNKWMAPVWLVKKHLENGESIPNPSWTGLDEIRAQFEAIVARIKKIDAGIAAENQKRRDAERKLAETEARKVAKLIAKLKSKVELEGEAALAFCRRRFTLGEIKIGKKLDYWPRWPANMASRWELKDFSDLIDFAKKQPKISEWKIKNAGKPLIVEKPVVKKERVPDQVLENVTVEWVTWGGTSKNWVKTEYSSDGCTVRFFGAKREITLPSGKVITKMEGLNLNIYPD